MSVWVTFNYDYLEYIILLLTLCRFHFGKKTLSII